MLKRIFNLLGFPRGTPAVTRGLPCIRTVMRNGIRVRVFLYECRAGHAGYYFVVDQATDKKDHWLQVATMRDVQMQAIIDSLQEGLDALDRGWRELRTVRFRDKTYFVDEKLMQLRNTENPHDFFDLREQA